MNINLAVPFFSQRDNSYIWKQRYENDITDVNTKEILYKKGSPVTDSSGKEKTVKIWDYCCNITCLAMVLNYLGVTQDAPYQMCEKIFADDYPKNPLKHADFDRYVEYRKHSNNKKSEGYECIESLEILKRIAKDIYNVRNVYTSSLADTLDDIKKQVESGYPVIVSCGITRPSLEWLKDEMETNPNPTDSTKAAYNDHKDDVNYEYHGHYIVIRGFTSAEDVIINDPWGKATDNDGKIPAAKIENVPQDAWGYYSTNIDKGSNKGENIIIKRSDFERQYHGKLWSVLIIYDRRWSFPFRHCLTNFTKDSQDTCKRYVPDQEQVEACYKLQVPGVYYPITSTCTPHNGIHINNGKHTTFYSIGSGMLVAAKLCNKENETIENGSNCFILIKHQVQTPNAPVDIKTFFCLYNHIRPLLPTGEDFDKIRFLNELNHEKNKDKEKRYFDELDKYNTRRDKNILQEEAEKMLERLMAGETVIFNEGKIISEVCEGDYLGQTDSKGFDPESVRDCMHWEIFSNENFFADKTRYGEYNIMDFTGINYYNRAGVIKSCKEKLFNGFDTDKKYSKYTWHLNKNAIATKGIDAFYSTSYSQKSRTIVLHNKSEWDSDRDFPTEYSNSMQKGYTQIKEDLSDFSDKYVKPFLWWDKKVDDAINKDLMLKITNKTPYYFEPINFLVWLMKNDDELYKQICPNAYDREFD